MWLVATTLDSAVLEWACPTPQFFATGLHIVLGILLQNRGNEAELRKFPRHRLPAGRDQGRARGVESNLFQAIPYFTDYRADKTGVGPKDLSRPKKQGLVLENKESSPVTWKVGSLGDTSGEVSHTSQFQMWAAQEIPRTLSGFSSQALLKRKSRSCPQNVWS